MTKIDDRRLLTYHELYDYMGLRSSMSSRCFAVVTLFLLSLLMQGYEPITSDEFTTAVSPSEAPTVIGQTNLLSIGSFPDGANTNTKLSVPDGEAIRSLDLNLEPAVLASATGFSFTDSSDFSSSTMYDGVDVNGSSLSILPQGWEWDFESANHGWTLGSPAWLWGYDSVLGPTNGVFSGTKAIYTYNGNYPNSMSSTIWATSPVMDCSSCSGAWELSFMKRLGVESDFYDHAYVAVKSSSGSWTNVYSSVATSDSSFFAQTISITNYVANNPSFQVRFGIGTTDGSVTYDGWNIDDVSVMPTGTGVSSGEGNWTSAPFSPSLLGQGEMKNYGYMYLDAVVPSGSIMEWRLLDASTNSPIPGFEHSTEKAIDLGVIDWEAYPSAKMHIHMKTQSGGAPVIHGIHFDGVVIEQFGEDPSSAGWDLQGVSWSGEQVSGSGTLVSPMFNLRSGFGGIASNSTLTGNGKIQYTLDAGTTWTDVLPGKFWLDSPSFSVQFRVVNTGGSWGLDTFDVELLRSSISDGLRIDVGMDGVSDWSMEGDGVGRLGIQDRFTDNSLWQTRGTTPSSYATYSMYLPIAGVDVLEFGIASPQTLLTSPFISMSINGQDFMSSSLPNIMDLHMVQLSATELASLNSALSQSTASHGPDGIPMVEVVLQVGSSTATTDVMVGGLFAPYDASVALEFDATDAVVVALNDALHSYIAVGGSKEIPLPIRMSSSGAVRLTLVQLSSQSSIEPVSITVSNVTDTFTPSTDWIEVSSVFDFSNLDVTDAESHAKSNGWSVVLNLQGQSSFSRTSCQIVSLPVSGSSVSGCTNQGTPMIWSHNGADGQIKMVGSGEFLQLDHRFKFTEQWNDEESLTVSVNLISLQGPMLPVSTNFGLGSSKGVENDVALKDWSVVSENGVRTQHNAAFLNPGEDVHVEVQLGFEGLPTDLKPRSGSTLVRFIVDGTELQSSSILHDGKVTFPWKTPVNSESTTVEITLSALNGQSIVYEVLPTLDFGFDTVDPELLGMSVEAFDHVEGAPQTSIDFLIADRPVLPSHALAHVWHSWTDDTNTDGAMQLDEVQTVGLHLPADLSHVQSNYRLDIDTSNAFSGSYFSGWLEVADSAGNVMLSNGSFETPLFNVQINSDGAPRLGSAPASWGLSDSDWLHPGELNTLELPLWDLNGITDIQSIELDLGGNQIEPVLITWNSTFQQCVSLEIYLTVESCELLPAHDDGLFSSEGTFKVNFTLEWGFDPDVSLVRIPSVIVRDLQGQSNTLQVPDLDWRFSGELEVDRSSLSYSIGGQDIDSIGSWVQPRDEVSITGQLKWFRSGHDILQPIELAFGIGGNEAFTETSQGTFSAFVTVPFASGSYGLFTSLENPPNGAIDRTPSSPSAWFIVDDQEPEVVGVASPSNGVTIDETDWSNINVEVLLKELNRLDADSLRLQWSIHSEGFGVNSPTLLSGNQSLTLIGGRDFGAEILCSTSLDLESLIDEDMRDESLELRIWVTGSDMAGHPVNPTFNDIDAPLSVWALEQRVAVYSFSEPDMKPNSNIVAGDLVSLNLLILNSGLANGSLQMYVDLVESNGARTRIDARSIDIEAGSTHLFTKDWIPDRGGTMWIEFQIANGPQAQTDTLYVDEAEADGVMGSLAGVSPGLLVIIFILSGSMIGLVVYALKVPQPQKSPTLSQPQASATPVPATPSAAPVSQPNSPYSATSQADSNRENPYQ